MGYHQCADLKPKKIDCLDDLQFQGMHLHKKAFKEILAAATLTMDAADNGKVILCEVTTVITLPSTGTAYGPFIFVNYAKDGVAQISISPAAADYIAGCDLTETDDTDLINTLATAKRGDYLVLVYGGTHGWNIAAMRGTWALAA